MGLLFFSISACVLLALYNHSHSHQTDFRSLYKHIESSLETWLHYTGTCMQLYIVSLRIGPLHLLLHTHTHIHTCTHSYTACMMTQCNTDDTDNTCSQYRSFFIPCPLSYDYIHVPFNNNFFQATRVCEHVLMLANTLIWLYKHVFGPIIASINSIEQLIGYSCPQYVHSTLAHINTLYMCKNINTL